MSNVNIKINLPGGIVSTGDLQSILFAAESAGASSIRFGNRQQLYFEIEEEQLEDLQHQFFVSDTAYEINANNFPNIVSSYVSEDIFDSTGWLREGVYKDILDSFSFTPKLKINLVDSSQTFIPFFTGNINFISAELSNYWYLYVRFPKTNHIYCWSTLVYSEDICEMSKRVELALLHHSDLFNDTKAPNGQLLEEMIPPLSGSIRQTPHSALQLPYFQIPSYEGFNKYGEHYWLGIYRRSERFPIVFLKDLCAISIQSRVGQIHTTPWRSILIKGIPPADFDNWKSLLKKHRINTRHAASELIWQTEDLCESGLELKQALTKEFNQEDLAVGDLCFAIKMNPKAGLFGSVIIRRLPIRVNTDDQERFEILHTADFNPNSKKLISYKEDVTASALSNVLIELCHHNADQSVSLNQTGNTEAENTHPNDVQEIVFQCGFCLSIYDEKFGDESVGIPAGTTFLNLPDTFHCPLCEAGKSAFAEVDKLKIYA